MTFLLEDHLSPEQLSLHVEKHYSVQVEKITKLDLNVFRLDILIASSNNSRQSWVARVHPSSNAFELISGLSEFLGYLHQQGFPAETSPTANPVTLINEHEIHGKKGCIFVTEFAEGTHPERNRGNFYYLGQLLGRLHSLPVPLGTIIGGAWHHLSFTGGFKEEVHAAITRLETFAQKHNINESDSPDHVNSLGKLYAALRQLCNSFDTHVLPTTLVHPDFAPVNIILREEASAGHIPPSTGWTVIDWTGGGVGVRVLSLGHLLACAAARGKLILVNAVMKGYSEHVHLEPTELEWLPQAVYARLLTIQCWEVAMERKELAKVADGLPELFQMGEDVASRVREILSAVRN